MSGINYLADTNCFIYLLEEHPMLLPFSSGIWSFSFITEMELLSKRGITSKEEEIIRKMLSVCSKTEHNQTITEITIKLRRKYAIKLPDAIIAATAKYLEIPLLTADFGFAAIKEIDCLVLEL